MLIPVTVTRVGGVEQYGGGTGPGRCAECPRCGRSKIVADDHRTPAKAARFALAELARTCDQPCGHLYRRVLPDGVLPDGVRLEWEWRDEWRPAHLLGTRVCGGSGEVGYGCPVRVTAEVVKANRKAELLSRRLRKRGWRQVVLELVVAPQPEEKL